MLPSISAIAAIIAITYIEKHALDRGINGKIMGLSIAAISGLGGFFLRGAFA